MAAVANQASRGLRRVALTVAGCLGIAHGLLLLFGAMLLGLAGVRQTFKGAGP